MTTEDQRTTDLLRGLPLGRVFISYAHDAVGGLIAPALGRELTARGCDVASDDDLVKLNPASIQAWMDEQITGRIVLIVLSPDYERAFSAPAEGVPLRAGVRYELRAIRQRIYDHRGNNGCPVIPVTAFGSEAQDPSLRSLVTEHFDPVTGAGADRIVSRIAALAGSGGDGAMAVNRPSATTGEPASVRRLVHDIDELEPASGEALQLVGAALELVPSLAQPAELLSAFPLFEKVIKAHGDVPLMRTLSQECLRISRSTRPLLQDEKLMEARVLIRGRGWHLLRDHRLQEAFDETRRGVRLADGNRDRLTAAVGRQCLGRIERLLAEEDPGSDVDYWLRQSTDSLNKAITLFSALEETGRNSPPVGACLSLAARTHLTRFRLLDDKAALQDAQELAEQADEILLPGTDAYYELTILRAELAALRRRGPEARQWLTAVIEARLGAPGAACSEILAHALQTRASLTPGARARSAEAISDLQKAEAIFAAQGLAHPAASCRWRLLKLDSKLVTPLKVTREDVLRLEKLEADPRKRLAALAELKQQEDRRIGKRPSARKINWESLLKQVRQRPD